MYLVCEKVCCVFGGLILCCVWEYMDWVWGSESLGLFGLALESECLLCVGLFGVALGSEFVGLFEVGFVGVILCCLWDYLELVWGSECVLFVGLF